jgi:hypothetical protein
MPEAEAPVLLRLAEFRRNLYGMMRPRILKELEKFLRDTGGQEKGSLEKYEWFCHNSTEGGDCKFALIAKSMFENDSAAKAAESIIWLYHNWAKEYEEVTK